MTPKLLRPIVSLVAFGQYGTIISLMLLFITLLIDLSLFDSLEMG